MMLSLRSGLVLIPSRSDVVPGTEVTTLSAVSGLPVATMARPFPLEEKPSKYDCGCLLSGSCSNRFGIAFNPSSLPLSPSYLGPWSSPSAWSCSNADRAVWSASVTSPSAFLTLPVRSVAADRSWCSSSLLRLSPGATPGGGNLACLRVDMQVVVGVDNVDHVIDGLLRVADLVGERPQHSRELLDVFGRILVTHADIVEMGECGIGALTMPIVDLADCSFDIVFDMVRVVRQPFPAVSDVIQSTRVSVRQIFEAHHERQSSASKAGSVPRTDCSIFS